MGVIRRETEQTSGAREALCPGIASMQPTLQDFAQGSFGKEFACNAGEPGLIPGLGRSPGEGNGNPLQSFPGKSRGQKSLVGYSPWGLKRVRHDLATKRQQQPSTSQEFLKDLTE